MNTQLWWYLARAGGIVAWALLAASVVWGLALSTRLLGPRPRPSWMLDLHRFLGGLALSFTAVHALGLVLDTYVSFGPVELLVPFTADYRPAAVAWGVISVYLLAAVEITSLLRRRLSRRAWRRTHLLSFPLFAAATVHGLTAGTDGSTLTVPMVATSVVVVGLAVASWDQHLHRPARDVIDGAPTHRPLIEPATNPAIHPATDRSEHPHVDEPSSRRVPSA